MIRKGSHCSFTGIGALLGIALAMMLCLIGCGSGKGKASSTGGVSGPTGRAVITLRWPEPTDTARLVPAAAKSVRIILKEGTTTVAERLLTRPATPPWVTIATIGNVPVTTLSASATAYPNLDGTGTAQATVTTPVAVQAVGDTNLRLTMASTIDRLDVTPTSTIVEEGGSVFLTATAKDATNAIVLTSALQWSSNSTAVVTVAGAGVVKAVAGGAGNTATITVTETESGKTATVTVKVIPLEPASPWQQATTFQIDPAHTGSISFGKPLTFPTSATWSVELGVGDDYSIMGSPIIADGKVFVTTHRPYRPDQGYGTLLYALDAATGKIVWGPVDILGDPWSVLTYENGRLFVVHVKRHIPDLSNYGALSAFDAATGTLLWSAPLPYQYIFSYQPTAINGTVYVTGEGSGNTLYAVNSLNGEIRWTRSIESTVSPTIMPEFDGLFVTSHDDQYRLHPDTGEIMWHNGDPGLIDTIGATASYRNGLLYFREGMLPNWDTIRGTIYDATTGATVDTFNDSPESYPIYIPALGKNVIVLADLFKLQALDAVTREVRWTFPIPADGWTCAYAPLIVNQTVIVATGSGKVYALDADSGAVVWTNSIITPIYNRTLPTDAHGMAAGEGYLVVPAVSRLTAWRLVAP